MFCDRCGNEIAYASTRCPFCGMPTEHEVQYTQPSAYQVLQGQQAVPQQDDLSSFGGPPLYQMGYRSVPSAGPSNGYVPLPQQVPGYASTSYAPVYPQGNITVIQNTSNDASVIAEIVLSLFGVFGIGWMMGGETTVGIILLLCSIFIYWPIMILGIVFTFGLGLICLIPLAIGAIIINALVCSRVLKRKTARLIVMQSSPPPHIPMPPPIQRPR